MLKKTLSIIILAIGIISMSCNIVSAEIVNSNQNNIKQGKLVTEQKQTNSKNLVYVNGSTVGESISKEGITYVPIAEIAEELGGEVFKYPSYYKLIIYGQRVEISEESWYAYIEKKCIPLATEIKNGVKVPVFIESFKKNNKLYIPLQFIEEGLKIPIKIEEDSIFIGEEKTEEELEDLDIGDFPKLTRAEEIEFQNLFDIGANSLEGKAYNRFIELGTKKGLAGWTIPKVKHKWSSKKWKNMKNLKNDLNLRPEYVFPVFKAGNIESSLTINDESGGDSYEVSYRFTGWGFAGGIPENAKVPYLIKASLELYFPDNYEEVFRVIEEKGDYLYEERKILVVGDREIFINLRHYGVNYFYISAPGKKIDAFAKGLTDKNYTKVNIKDLQKGYQEEGKKTS